MTLCCQPAESRSSSRANPSKTVRALLGRFAPVLAAPLLLLSLAALAAGCGEPETKPSGITGNEITNLEPPDAPPCQLEEGLETLPQYLAEISCRSDFEYMAAEPTTSSVPGARSAKVVLDTLADGTPDENKVYFQDSTRYGMHHDFVSECEEILARGPVAPLQTFNQTEYSSPDRRFILAAVTHYEPQQMWALEFSPYDTASNEMIERLYRAAKASGYFGDVLYFHPTWDDAAKRNKDLDPSVKVITNDELYAKTDYQPLNLGETVGQLRFLKAKDLDTEYVSPKEVIVLDAVPNDIAVVAGLITEQFQTPLSHVNVLAQNRGTPNMGLRHAFHDPELLALKGEWVRLTVTDRKYAIERLTQAEADGWWEENGPEQVSLREPDRSQRALLDTDQIIEDDEAKTLKQKIHEATLIYGAKVANYAVLAAYKRLDPSVGSLDNTLDDGRDIIPVRKAFGIPACYYMEFMEQNGLFELYDEMRSDPLFVSNPFVRDKLLAKLRQAIVAAPVDQELQDRLRAKIESPDFAGKTLRFRSSTNAEDLDGFPCAGCYDSHTGAPAQWDDDLLRAIRQGWSTVWKFRTYEEREFHHIDHKKVAMALLVHENFPYEYANGVAITNNPFNRAGNDPAFYINVQRGGAAEVVAPPLGVTTDMFLLYGQGAEGGGLVLNFMSRSNLVSEDAHVLTATQTRLLGDALDSIHMLFTPAYSADDPRWAMDVEFKFNDEGDGRGPVLWVKQARPYHGRG